MALCAKEGCTSATLAPLRKAKGGGGGSGHCCCGCGTRAFAVDTNADRVPQVGKHINFDKPAVEEPFACARCAAQRMRAPDQRSWLGGRRQEPRSRRRMRSGPVTDGVGLGQTFSAGCGTGPTDGMRRARGGGSESARGHAAASGPAGLSRLAARIRFWSLCARARKKMTAQGK